MLRLLFFICCFIDVLPGRGQHNYFRHYQVENGLSNNTVFCIVQDAKGFLWFGTPDGLNRFDGYTFKIFRNDKKNKSSIGNNNIICLYVDTKGKMWVGTEKGLFAYEPETESFQLLKTDSLGVIRDMQMDSLGNLWFIENGTLTAYNTATQKLTYYKQDRYFSATSLCIINKQLWVSAGSGMLEKFDEGTNSFLAFNVFGNALNTQNKYLEKLYATSNGDIMIGTATHGVKIFYTKDQRFKDILSHGGDNTSIFAWRMIQVSGSEYWLGTESGIYSYNEKTGEIYNIHKQYNDPYALSDNSIHAFCKDSEGGIWVGTYSGGVNYYSNKYNFFEKFFPKNKENSLSGNVVRDISEDKMGNLWIATEDAGLNKLDPSSGRFTNFLPNGGKNNIAYKDIHGILVDGDDLWLGTFIHGLDVMDIKTGKIKKHCAVIGNPTSVTTDLVNCISFSPDSQLIFGTIKGAYVYNRKRDDFSVIKELPVHDYVSILHETDGTLWAGSNGQGISLYNTKTGQKATFKYDITNDRSIASDVISSIFKDSRGQLWVGTRGGLCLFNRKSNDFQRYTTENGLPSDLVLSMLEDGRRNLWVTTTRGLACFNLDNGHLKTYTTDDGLLSDQFNYSSALKSKSGKMYFGSIKGLIGFNPDSLPMSPGKPPIYITGFQVNNKELSIAQAGSPLQKSIILTDKIDLAHNQSSFSIDFAALDYASPKATEYAYMMEGLDKGWTYLKSNRKAYFTELPSGTYQFKVKTSVDGVNWDGQERTLTVLVLPPWWLSVYAYIFYIVVGIAIIVLLIDNYKKRLQNKNKREMEKKELLREKETYEEKLDFFTNVAHEIKTPLTLIRGPLDSLLKKAAIIPEIDDSLRIMDRSTKRLMDLTTQFLDFRQTEIKGFSLNFTRVNVSEALTETLENFRPLVVNRGLVYQINMPQEPVFAQLDAEAFNKILTNLFSNAVKYAETKVEINFIGIIQTKNLFAIEISNDGFVIPQGMAERIFEPFFRLKETQKYKGTGIGLALSLTLAKLLKGMIILKNDRPGLNTFLLTMPTEQEYV